MKLEKTFLMSDFIKGLYEVGDLLLEDLTTIHSSCRLVIQSDLLATYSTLQAVASAIALSLGGLEHCLTDLFTSPVHSPIGLATLSDRMRERTTMVHLFYESL